MATDAHHDSRLEFSIGPLADPGEAALFDLPPSDDLLRPELPVIDLASNEPLPQLPDNARLHPPPTYDPPLGHVATEVDAAGRTPGEIWLDGDVLMCPCPDCRAPMSIRLWLMIADCWRCGTSIELTEEQEREAMRLLEQRERAQRERTQHTGPQRTGAEQAAPRREPESRSSAPATPPAASSPTARATQPTPREEPTPPKPSGSPLPSESRGASSPTTPPAKSTPQPPSEPNGRAPDSRAARGPAAPVAPQTPRRPSTNPNPATHGSQPRPSGPSPAAGPRPAARRPMPAALAPSPARRRLQQETATGLAQAWVRSLFRDTPAWLVSLVFHLVALTLLAMLGPQEDDGEQITLSMVLSAADREGGDRAADNPLDDVKFDLPIPETIDPNNEEQREVLIRADQEARELRIDPESINPQMPELSRVKQTIGTASSIKAALAARDPRVRVEMVQQEGGTTMSEAAVARALRWIASQQRPDGRWNLESGANNDMAATSLALLPFLGAGQTHIVGRYQDTVGRGLRWMLDHQRPDGDLRYAGGSTGMYAHGQATIVLCEAFALSGDEELRVPAQRALDYIVKAQHIGGGWRYGPNEPGDTSVLGWQLMALQSGRAASLTVPDVTLELANNFLDSVQSHGGSRYAYMPQQRNNPTHRLTAEALLCRVYLGWKSDNPGLMEGLDWLLENNPPAQQADIYYWYYATQAFHHYGGESWDRWNSEMRDTLVDRQERRGPEAGSWSPHDDKYGREGGRLFVTALATCTLEVYYRHLPIFRQIDID